VYWKNRVNLALWKTSSAHCCLSALLMRNTKWLKPIQLQCSSAKGISSVPVCLETQGTP